MHIHVCECVYLCVRCDAQENFPQTSPPTSPRLRSTTRIAGRASRRVGVQSMKPSGHKLSRSPCTWAKRRGKGWKGWKGVGGTCSNVGRFLATDSVGVVVSKMPALRETKVSKTWEGVAIPSHASLSLGYVFLECILPPERNVNPFAKEMATKESSSTRSIHFGQSGFCYPLLTLPSRREAAQPFNGVLRPTQNGERLPQ